MTRPEHPRPPLPDDLTALLRHMAVAEVNKLSIGKKNPLLWSKSFPLPGMGNDVSIELLPSLVLRVRNRVTDEVFMQTEPVSFGPLAPNSETLSERFEQWCAERRGDPVAAASANAQAGAAEECGQS